MFCVRTFTVVQKLSYLYARLQVTRSLINKPVKLLVIYHILLLYVYGSVLANVAH